MEEFYVRNRLPVEKRNLVKLRVTDQLVESRLQSGNKKNLLWFMDPFSTADFIGTGNLLCCKIKSLREDFCKSLSMAKLELNHKDRL